jgi:hypothetical protein
MDKCSHAALKLHRYLVVRHWKNQALVGPDPGIRFNYRLGRFIKSYLPAVSWADDLCYMQAQGYWVLDNWHLFSRTGEETYHNIAFRCSEYILAQQRDDGAWEYPNPAWKGRIATVEGTWGSLGLLESYRQSTDPRFLEGALRWHRFLIETIGFQRSGDELAINYFADRPSWRVPNNSALVLRFLAELADVTGDTSYLQPCAGLLTFLQSVQKPTGELPYEIEGTSGGKCRLHFQCYQYHAFQCLDLSSYYRISGDQTSLPLITGVLEFLRTGQANDGHAFYECGKRHREVTYHTAVLGAAFAKAGQLGLDGYEEPANRAYTYLLRLQRSDGGFIHSQGDYRRLTDRRSYPRYLAMILYHLLLHDPAMENTIPRKELVHDNVC